MSYQVNFYRKIVNSYGKPFKASVYTTEIEALGSMDDAIATAIDAFKRDQGLSCWSALADGYEVRYERKSIPITTDRDVVAADGVQARPGDSPRGSAARSRAPATPTGGDPYATWF